MHFSFIGKAQFRRATLFCDSSYYLHHLPVWAAVFVLMLNKRWRMRTVGPYRPIRFGPYSYGPVARKVKKQQDFFPQDRVPIWTTTTFVQSDFDCKHTFTQHFIKVWRPWKKKALLTLRQHIKRRIKDAYQICLQGLHGLNDGESKCDNKKLFSFLKNSRQDRQGSTPLKQNNKIVTDTIEQTNIYNDQFQSVFQSVPKAICVWPGWPKWTCKILLIRGALTLQQYHSISKTQYP